MTYDEVHEYLTPAMRGLGIENTISEGLRLDQELGIDAYGNYYHSEYDRDYKTLTPELKNLYRALAGPHGRTVLKMWRIKKGLEHATEAEASCAD